LVVNDSRKDLLDMPVVDLIEYMEDIFEKTEKIKQAQGGR
jgi:hypothetical protein